MQQLLGVVRLGRDVRSLAELQHGLLRGRPVTARRRRRASARARRPAHVSRAPPRRRPAASDVLAVERCERSDRAGVAHRVAPAPLDLGRRHDDLFGELAEWALRLGRDQPDRTGERARSLERERRVALVADATRTFGLRPAQDKLERLLSPAARLGGVERRTATGVEHPRPRAGDGRSAPRAATPAARRSPVSSPPLPRAQHLAFRAVGADAGVASSGSPSGRPALRLAPGGSPSPLASRRVRPSRAGSLPRPRRDGACQQCRLSDLH